MRDGGYYNRWDFSVELINQYLAAMAATNIDVVELGFRSLDTDGFRGACAYTGDDFIRGLSVPAAVELGVMVNASELLKSEDIASAVHALFKQASDSPVSLVRIACHMKEIGPVLPASRILKDLGYRVGINLMQIADRSESEIVEVAESVSRYPVDVLYFADSLGGLDEDKTAWIVNTLKKAWSGAVGVHTHDNMGKAIGNSMRALSEGATWVDSTVTGMGRGPGNAQTEYLAIEMQKLRGARGNLVPLLELIRSEFKPLQEHYGWGKNPYYYLSGEFGIHPTYIQEMLADPRYGEAELLAVIDHLRAAGAKKFNIENLDAGRQMYGGAGTGAWAPKELIKGREVLIIASGPSVAAHKGAIERYIAKCSPVVIALNTNSVISSKLVDLRVACHPFRLIADFQRYSDFREALVLPRARLPEVVGNDLDKLNYFDFGLTVNNQGFKFHDTWAEAPSPLVIAYALAIATSGKASHITIAGMDGYAGEDPRNDEVEEILEDYSAAGGCLELRTITPSRYSLAATSVYAL